MSHLAFCLAGKQSYLVIVRARGNPSGAWQPASQCSDPCVRVLVIGVMFGVKSLWTQNVQVVTLLNYIQTKLSMFICSSLQNYKNSDMKELYVFKLEVFEFWTTLSPSQWVQWVGLPMLCWRSLVLNVSRETVWVLLSWVQSINIDTLTVRLYKALL